MNWIAKLLKTLFQGNKMNAKENGGNVPTQSLSHDSFQTFGDLLKYLRRRARLTQLELSIAVGYSDAQITRLEKNQRRPEIAAVKALFVPALGIENEPEMVARLLELAESARQEELPVQGIAPYKGLLFFDETDAAWYFGREALTLHLMKRVEDLAVDASSRFLAVVGASGSGKSSLVRAGLGVALKQAGWDVRTFTPGVYPSKTLHVQQQTDASRKPHLILVDQFEETFTLCHDEAERLAFIETLLQLAQEPSKQPTVVIALRADFYSHCSQYPVLREAVAAEQEYIGQMNSEELRRAIEEPARRGGWELEPGLVDLLLQDIGVHGTSEPEPGALPLLSHALLATWERRRGSMLTLEGYRASGGVRGAIAETAESVFTDQLNQTQQEVARDVFVRLTELGEGTEDTRRRAALNELVHQSTEATQLRAVLHTLAEARLVTLNEDSAEVAHEALIREWQRLHEWLTQDREGLLLHRHITESAQEWEARGHDSSELYRGARLAQAREWASVNEERLNASERAFLSTSINQEQHEALEREAQRQRELEAAQKLAESERRSVASLRGRNRVITAIGGAAVVLAVLASVFGVQSSSNLNAAEFANTQSSANAAAAQAEAQNRATAEADAVKERNIAQQQSLIASIRELSSEANLNLEIDPERSILLALQAVNKTYAIDQTVLPEAEDALRRAVQASRVQLTLQNGTEPLWSAVFSPDGTRIATGSDDGATTIWDAVSGKELSTFQTSGEGAIVSVAFSPNSKLLATGSDDKIARIWDVSTGQELAAFDGHSDGISHVVFSPDGNSLATSSSDGTSKVWDISTRQELFTLNEESNGFRVAWVAFSPDGSKIATAGTENQLSGWASVWDTKTGQKILNLPGHGPAVRSVAFSPDGSRIVTANEDRTATIWDVNSGKELFTLYGHTDIVEHADFSPDGMRIVTTSDDRHIKVWDAVTGQELLTLAGHTGSVWSVSFNPDSQHIVTTSDDKTAKVWSISPTQELLTVVNGPRILFPAGARLTYSPDGTRLATANSDPTPKIWDMATGELLLQLVGHTDIVTNITYNADGTKIATASNDGTAKIWDASTGDELQSFVGHKSNVFGIDFSPDGTRLATSSWDQTAIIWNASTGKALFELTGHTERLGSVDYSPDGSLLVTSSWDGAAIVWEAATGKELFPLIGSGVSIRRAVFNSDGTGIVTAGFDGTARVWDVTTGKELRALSGHTGNVLDAVFSQDDAFIATASGDKSAKVWDAITGKELWTFRAPDGLTGVAFSPDGTQLAVGSRDGTARIYLLRIEDLIELAKQRVTRSLTREECQQYLHVEQCPAQP